ncbi:hypothetical protein HK102_003097 [Quaeritorhiza haematococci]|nr:hypothetical protein HK102_003097 [Quaeritorhiza haematococci]
MPCILKVRIVAARNLPVMDRATELTDAFVEMHFANKETQRTQICKRTLNPVWNEDFRFEVSDDADLQNEPLEIKVMDYDQITYNDAIGTVFIDLNPLLTWDSTSQIAGWFPIYDTLQGVRGELNLQVKLQFFGDINPFKDSSAGVQFFTVTRLPPTYHVVSVLGFVGALDTEDDPEYHWSDNFRTPRTSNEARTRIMFQLSGQLRRQLGKKVLELGGNAVIGFKQSFDLESEKRAITARAIGTAVRLALPEHMPAAANEKGSSWMSLQSPMSSPTGQPLESSAPSPKPASLALIKPDKDSSSAGSPKDQTANSAALNLLGGAAASQLPYKPLEQQILTLHSFPKGSILGIGGLVSATSVKIIDNDDREVREAWWNELRDEIKSHARTLGCPFVIGYSESTTVNDDLNVLYCVGTAAMIDPSVFSQQHDYTDNNANTTANSSSNIAAAAASIGTPTNVAKDKKGPPGSKSVSSPVGMGASSLSSPSSATDGQPTIGKDGSGVGAASEPMMMLTDAIKSASPEGTPPRPIVYDSGKTQPRLSLSLKETGLLEAFARRRRQRRRRPACQACHIPYRRHESPFPMSFVKCAGCSKKYVPEMLLTTVEPPPELQTIGKGILLEAHVCRQKKSRVGESNANIVSEAIPFAQYDLHRQLMYKLRIHGLNAVFGIKFQITIGESLMTAVATGTALYVKSLPPPPPLKVYRNLDVVDEEDQRLLEIQRKIVQQSEQNRRQIEMALAEDMQRMEAAGTEDIASTPLKVDGSGTQTPKSAAVTSMGAERATIDGDDGNNSDDSDDSGSSSEDEDDDDDLEQTHGGTSGAGGGGGRQKSSVVVQIDDEQDEDLVLLLDPIFPTGFHVFNMDTPPSLSKELFSTPSASPLNFQTFVTVKQGAISTSHHPNRQLANMFKDLYHEILFQLAYLQPPVVVAGIDYDIFLPKDNEVQIRMTAIACGQLPTILGNEFPLWSSNSNITGALGNSPAQQLLRSASSTASMTQEMTTGTLPLRESLQFGNSIAGGPLTKTPTSTQPQTPRGPQSLRLNLSVGGTTTATTIDRDTETHDDVADQDNDDADEMFAMEEYDDSKENSTTSLGTSPPVSEMKPTEFNRSQSMVVSNSSAAAMATAGRMSVGTNVTSPTNLANGPQSAVQRNNSYGYGRDASHSPFSPTASNFPGPFVVEITPLPRLPNTKIDRTLGRLSLHFVKESNIVYESALGLSGMGGFTHAFLAELFAVVRAHTAALGGNALVGFSVEQSVLSESLKNQGYAFFSVAGDVVEVSREAGAQDTSVGGSGQGTERGGMGGTSGEEGRDQQPGVSQSAGGSGEGGPTSIPTSTSASFSRPTAGRGLGTPRGSVGATTANVNDGGGGTSSNT